MSSTQLPSATGITTETCINVEESSCSSDIIGASLLVHQENLLCQHHSQSDYGTRRFKKMVAWKTLVEDEEKSIALLMILNENKAHITDQKKDYDNLICITFEEQMNSNGKHDGNALFGEYQEWTFNIRTEK